MTADPPPNLEELLAVLLSREVRDWETSACGAVSHIPATALLLAEATHAPHAQIIILGSEEYGRNLGKDFHFVAQRGQLDLFFISGIQIDAEGNFNLHVIGDPDAPDFRLPGGYGTGLLYYTAKRVLLFRTEHTARTFVPKVDFVSGALKTPDKIKRPRNSTKVVTPMAVLTWEYEAERWALESVQAGYSVQDVQENTGFDLLLPEQVPTTPEPAPQELHTLRTVVRERMIETDTYPEFARSGIQQA